MNIYENEDVSCLCMNRSSQHEEGVTSKWKRFGVSRLIRPHADVVKCTFHDNQNFWQNFENQQFLVCLHDAKFMRNSTQKKASWYMALSTGTTFAGIRNASATI